MKPTRTPASRSGGCCISGRRRRGWGSGWRRRGAKAGEANRLHRQVGVTEEEVDGDGDGGGRGRGDDDLEGCGGQVGGEVERPERRSSTPGAGGIAGNGPSVVSYYALVHSKDCSLSSSSGFALISGKLLLLLINYYF